MATCEPATDSLRDVPQPVFVPVCSNFPCARRAAELSTDSLTHLADLALWRIESEVKKAAKRNRFSVTVTDLMHESEGVQAEVLIYLKNLGYVVEKYYDADNWYCGHTISWYPEKTVRDVEEIPWWKFWRKQ